MKIWRQDVKRPPAVVPTGLCLQQLSHSLQGDQSSHLPLPRFLVFYSGSTEVEKIIIIVIFHWCLQIKMLKTGLILFPLRPILFYLIFQSMGSLQSQFSSHSGSHWVLTVLLFPYLLTASLSLSHWKITFILFTAFLFWGVFMGGVPFVLPPTCSFGLI